MGVKKHYDQHLAKIYSWMVGDLELKSEAFRELLVNQNIQPKDSGVALDLGAGNGIQSIAMKACGFEVTAIDFNQQLLEALKSNPLGTGIAIELADIRNVLDYKHLRPELIACCGDTIAHLESKQEIQKFISDASAILSNNGHLILSFRDYSKELTDQQRFIPVKSSADRILTCILEYSSEKIKVTDLLHEKIKGRWAQKLSSYYKVRITPSQIMNYLEDPSLSIKLNQPIDRMHTIIVAKSV